MLLVASQIFGWNQVIAGLPSVSGGIIAALVTIEGLKSMNLEQYIVIAMTIVATQSLVGMPITANLMKKYASGIQKKYREGLLSSGKLKPLKDKSLEAATDAVEKIPYGTDENPSPKYKVLLPKKIEVDTIMLVKLLIVDSVAVFLSKMTTISSSIWALVVGLLGAYFGIYRGRMLNRAHSI